MRASMRHRHIQPAERDEGRGVRAEGGRVKYACEWQPVGQEANDNEGGDDSSDDDHDDDDSYGVSCAVPCAVTAETWWPAGGAGRGEGIGR